MKNLTRKIRIDMTPFVDVAFLLLIFFVWLNILQKPNLFPVNLPDEYGCGPQSDDLPPKYLSIYLAKDNLILYSFDTNPNEIKKADFKEIRHVLFFWKLRNKSQHPLVIIKSTRHATFKNVIDIFDEMALSQNKRYTFLSDQFTINERLLLKDQL